MSTKYSLKSEDLLSLIVVPDYKILTFQLIVCKSFTPFVLWQESSLNTISFITNELTKTNFVLVGTTHPNKKFLIYIFILKVADKTFGITYKLFVFHSSNYISKTFRNLEFSPIKALGNFRKLSSPTSEQFLFCFHAQTWSTFEDISYKI